MWTWLVGLSSDNWQAIGSIGTLLIATVAAVFAKRQVDEAKSIRLEQTQPQIIVDFETHSLYIMLVIQNTGTTTARDVRLDFDPPLQTTLDAGKEALSSSLLTTSIPSMPPGKRYSILFEHGPTWYEQDSLPARYTAEVTFGDSSGRRHKDSFVLDYKILYDYRTISIYTVHDVAKALRSIDKNVSRWTSHDGLAVVARDGDRADERDQAYFEEMRERERRERQRGRLP